MSSGRQLTTDLDLDLDLDLDKLVVADPVVNKSGATRMVANSGEQIIHHRQTSRSSSDPVEVRLRAKGSQVQIGAGAVGSGAEGHRRWAETTATRVSGASDSCRAARA